MVGILKSLLLPNHPVKCPILFGPLRMIKEHQHAVEPIYQKSLPLLGRKHRDFDNFPVSSARAR
jgi:hypothetical protein